MISDLGNRFEYHPATTENKRKKHSTVRELCLELAENLDTMIPDGREKSLVITKLEEVMFWANAAIARERESE